MPKPPAATAEVQRWEQAGAHCSANERRADEASRDVEAWLKCRFMRDHLGEEYSGTVRSVTNFGVFVILDALYVEGLVHITELGGEYFNFDEARGELRGEHSGVRYAIGSRVRVQVSRVDLDGRKIDFRMIRDVEVEPALTRARKDASATTELQDLKAKDRATKAARAKAIASRMASGKLLGKAGGKSVGKSPRPGQPTRGHKPR